MPALPWKSGPSGPRKPFRIGWALAPVVVFHPKKEFFSSLLKGLFIESRFVVTSGDVVNGFGEGTDSAVSIRNPNVAGFSPWTSLSFTYLGSYESSQQLRTICLAP